jgi:hypothetical protein
VPISSGAQSSCALSIPRKLLPGNQTTQQPRRPHEVRSTVAVVNNQTLTYFACSTDAGIELLYVIDFGQILRISGRGDEVRRRRHQVPLAGAEEMKRSPPAPHEVS